VQNVPLEIGYISTELNFKAGIIEGDDGGTWFSCTVIATLRSIVQREKPSGLLWFVQATRKWLESVQAKTLIVHCANPKYLLVQHAR